MQLYHQMVYYDFERTYYKMTVSDKIKTVDNKIVQNKGRYNLDRQTAKILVLSTAAIKKFE